MSGQVLSLLEAVAGRAMRSCDAGTRARARLNLLDWLAGLAGARADPLSGAAVRATAQPLVRAALLGSVLEMDDVDRLGRVHPGPVVWAAALLAADRGKATMGRFLEGAVAGYEACISIARMLDDHHYAHCHPTHTAGRFGAAAAAARVAGLGLAEAVHALAIAGSSAGAYWQVRNEAATSKAFHLADAVLGGLFAADCAAAGMTGPARLLEGPQGLFAALCRRPNPPPESRGWLLSEVSLKPWAACRHAHPAIDAALALPPGALARGPIRVATYGDALVFCDRPAPATPAEARFSLQHAVAVVAARGRPTPADFGPEAIGDAAIAAARARVTLEVDAAFSARYPAHFGARVAAGGVFAEVVDAWGDPEWPMDEAAVAAKLRALVALGGLGEAEAEAALAAARAPEEAGVGAVAGLVGRWLA
ncbi:MmgE/PrpD family protein [Thermaurantiacus sp.]